jgi:hypothetical protein
VEAARIPWRPLGRLLVEQGLLTAEELELALAKQEETGRLLGQTIVECGFVSGPELSNALAAQYGIELTAETGFGTGLRTEIQRRHESERRKILHSVPDVIEEPEPVADAKESAQEPEDEASVHAQLEKQWAKLAAAEALLAETARERDSLRSELALERERRREQVLRLVDRVRDRNAHVARLAADVRGCDLELDRLRDENERTGLALAAAQAELAVRDLLLEELPAEPRTVAPDEHVVLVQLAGRYELLEREGPPPPRNAVLVLPEVCDRPLVVAGLGRSPLPGDARACIFAQPA